MPAYRLLNDQGRMIGSVILDSKQIEHEILNGQPALELTYSTSLASIHSFVLTLIPPEGASEENH